MTALKLLVLWILARLGLVKAPDFVVRYAPTHPSQDQIGRGEMVIVRNGSLTKWACIKCPCGCGDKISLSLDQDRRPSWTVSEDFLSRPTVYPSVHQLARCNAHFWIKSGKVKFTPDSGRPNVKV
ncbi:MAG: hypothetical protein K8F62_03650 [Pseudorhodoplanes sp.]|nr:hypothetical protein [Pseudorhodoplanes sp.]